MKTVILFLIFTISSGRNFELDMESGIAFVSYSDIRIPKSTGTLISFSDELKTDPAWFIRGRLTYFFNQKHSLSVLIAPLKLYASGSVDHDVVFEGVTFPANESLNTIYKFNSYRLSYQYYFPVCECLRFGLGATAKIRDAAISIRSDNSFSEKTNIGFVPIVRFSCWWRFAKPLVLQLEGDALASPYGRAEDISVGIYGILSNRLSLKTGYRVLEGGSDVEEVYSFTWVNYIFGGFRYGF